jgi:hypothetical protein
MGSEREGERGREPEVEVEAREARWEMGEKIVQNGENSTKEYQEDAFRAVKDETSTAQTGKRHHANVGTEQHEFDDGK